MVSEKAATFPRIGTKVRFRLSPLWVIGWTVNGILLAITLAAFLYADVGVDWDIYTEAGQRFFTGGLYEWEGLPYRYSPLLAPFFALIAPIGYLGWSALHFGALLLLPYRVGMIALVFAPFWNDVYNGNTMTFVLVAAYWTVKGNRWGTLAFLALCVLIPRPVMLPVLGWLLWTRREYVLPFAGIFAVHAVLVAMTGWGAEWIAHLASSGQDIYEGADLGPARFLGLWWYPFGLAIAAWLTVRGRLGWASVFATPYWLLHYGLMLLIPNTQPIRRTAPTRLTQETPTAPSLAPER